MGINIDGARDLVSAGDGSLTIEGFSLNTSGIATFTGGVKVGTAASIYSNGNASFAGIVTATAFVDDGTNLITEINTKATTGKAIAMAMIFGG